MKIAIPVESNQLNADVHNSFGRAPYFLIYDSETHDGTFVNNSAAASSGGAGIKAAQIIVDSGASVLLTPRCGEKAADVLQLAEIELYKTKAISAQENIAAFEAGQLKTLDEIHAGFHGHGDN
ncbi:MAG TPA: dinitrogenase iron-molybdenum cofactor biosynthesis protein [Clostridiaceae bacterium]|nr:dinitrogenase iron-molybdenum cofactor biosynthesis protein [Clostridiaceae bacterium]